MSQEIRRCAYLEALARLQPRWDHDVNDDFGAVSIQIELLIAMVASERGPAIDIAKLTPASYFFAAGGLPSTKVPVSLPPEALTLYTRSQPSGAPASTSSRIELSSSMMPLAGRLLPHAGFL